MDKCDTSGSGDDGFAVTTTPLLSPVSNVSLTEHSYCASANLPWKTGPDQSSNRSIEEHGHPHFYGIGVDYPLSESVPGGNRQLSTEVTTSQSETEGFGGDVINFDGFDFAIPSSEGDDVVLDNLMWGSTMLDNGITEITTVEIASTNIGDLENDKIEMGAGRASSDIEVVTIEDDMEDVDEGKPKTKQAIKGSKKGSKAPPGYSRPRRRDFIEDLEKRQVFFEDTLKKLASHLRRAKCRTGCESELSANFNGKMYVVPSDALSGPPPAEPMSQETPGASLLRSALIGQGDKEDHCYAATVLTQNAMSTDVQDHQYNEKASTHFEWDEDDIEDSEADQGKKVKRLERFDYIQVTSTREQTLNKFVRSVFWQKTRLEERTGATVTLEVRYGRCIFNDKNFKQCAALILESKKKKKPIKQTLPIAPKISSAPPLTLIVPSQELPALSLATPVHYVLPQNAAISSTLQHHYSMPSLLMTSEMFSQNRERTDVLTDQVQFIQQQQSDQSVNRDTMKVEPPEYVAAGYSAAETEESNYNMSQGSPQIVSTSGDAIKYKKMKECATNTEPICAICYNSDRISGGSSLVRKNSFWIRCNHPFCYYMIHASCLGFMVTSADPKQMPAFYCELHR